MDKRLRRRLKLGASLALVVAALLGLVVLINGTALADRSLAPAGAPRTATLPPTPCETVGTLVTCELWAVTGTLSLPDGAGVPIRGYSATGGAGSAQLPGPTLIVTEGLTVEVTLHNNLAESTALIFPGQTMLPDLDGVTPGSTKAYTFTASSPGTYLYEAGLLNNAQHQVAMGMFGALVVRPTLGATYAYGDATSAFDDEALLVLSEIDPALHNSADPAAFDMRDYAPKYFLINGKAYPDTEPITSTAGSQVLLRIANAGIVQHSIGTLGVDQQVIALDGSPLTYTYTVAAATVGSGQTSDRLVTVPASAGTDGETHYAVYDSSMLLHNNGAAGFGGMLTFITVADGAAPIGGPSTTAVSLDPNPADGSIGVAITATIPGATSAEYFIDAKGTDGGGTGMSGAGDEWTADISIADLALLSSGDHTIFVHGSDGTWGAFNFDVLHLDKLGPASRGISLVPNPSNGTAAVTVSATGDDTDTGNSAIADAEFFIDATGADGAGTPLAVNVAEPIASLDGSIDATTMAALSEGEHTIYVHSMDAFGHWGDFDMATLVVDQTGPTTSDVTADPNPNNGALPYNPTRHALRVDATVADTSSAIERVEGFINTVGADGSGFPLTPADALFDELAEKAYAYVPLSTINALSEGTHQIWIHGQDASGNWGATVAVDLVIDKTTPTVSGVSAAPNPTGAAASTDLTASASDGDSFIAGAEWFDGADPGRGNGTPMAASDGAFDGLTEALIDTIDVTTWAPGDHALSVRAMDAAGNWSAAETTVLCVVNCDAIFADSFTSGDTGAWSSTTGPVSVIGPGMDGDGNTMAADITGGNSAFVTDGTPAAETSYHARFLFNPNGADSQNNAEIWLLDGQDGASNSIFRVEYRRRNARGGSYQVRGVVLTAGGEQATAWVDINDASINAIEIAWESGTNASFSLYVHDGLQETLTGLDTSAYSVNTINLGPSGGAGLDGGASGSVYLDAFVSTRYTIIGP